MDVWSGDGRGGTGSTLAQRVPVSIERIAWAGDRILYGGFVGGRPTILQVTPGKASSEEIVRDALTPGATSDGRTIVFVSSAAGALDLWTADASGRRIAQLVPGVTASQIVVTPDYRAVLYTSLAGGAISIWTVPLAGGTSTKLVDGGAAAVSPDGRTLAFVVMGRPQASLSVCALPGCTSPRTIGSARSDAAVAWTPDGGGGVVCARGEPLGAGARRRGAASAHAFRRHPSDRIVRVVARGQAPGRHAIDGDERHRPL
jgi:Tol biopolymer transport system component